MRLYVRTHELTQAAVQSYLSSIYSDLGWNCFQPANICHDKASTQFHFPAPTSFNFNIIPSFPTFLNLTPGVSLQCLQLVNATPRNFPITTVLQKSQVTLQQGSAGWLRFARKPTAQLSWQMGKIDNIPLSVTSVLPKKSQRSLHNCFKRSNV